MGASTSKPTETKVFTPQTPVDFSPSLVAQLEKSIEVSIGNPPKIDSVEY